MSQYQTLSVSLEHRLLKPAGDAFQLKLNTELPLSKGVIGVYGESGQGKSTFLKLCAGIISNNTAQIRLAGETELVVNQLSLEHNPFVYQGQDMVLFEHLTVEENLDLVIQHGIWRSKPKGIVLEKGEVIRWCDIEALLGQGVASLSGGEKQRVGLARSLLSGKPILLLDEPFTALDWQRRWAMLNLLKQLQQSKGLTLVIVSHSLKELAHSCQYLVHIDKGQIKQAGPSDTVIRGINLNSSEPLFSTLKVTNKTPVDAGRLCQWQLKDSLQFIYSKLQSDSERTLTHAGEATEIVNVDADKVSVSLAPIADTSMLNQLQGRIVNIEPYQHLQLLTLDVDGQSLFSLVSGLSLQRLKLKIGQTLFAQFKAV